MTVQLKRNDTKDTISYTVTNLDGSVVNLTGATVKFVMGKNKTLITNAAATIVSAAAGQVSYTLTEADTLAAGTFNAEFEITFSNGKVKTYPTNGYILVNIQANVDKDQSTYIADQIAYRVSDIQILKNSIQAQLDQFAKGDSAPEVAQARVEADGTTNTTLKARLDKKEAEFENFRDEISSSVAQKAAKDEVTFVSTRLDNIIAHNGDGTKDTELIDARTNIFSNVSQTVGSRISSIERDLNGESIIISPAWVIGYINGSTGALGGGAPNPNLSTPFLSLKKGTKIQNKHTGYIRLYKYDTSNVFVGRIADIAGGTTYTLTEDINARMTLEYGTNTSDTSLGNSLVVITAPPQFSKINTINTDVNTLKTNVSDIQIVAFEENYRIIPTWQLGYINGADGVEKSNNVTARTADIIYLPKGSTIEVTDTNVTVAIHKYLNGVWNTMITAALTKAAGKYTFTENTFVRLNYGYTANPVISDLTLPNNYITINKFTLKDYIKSQSQGLNYWTGKKIAWFGTSIPAGNGALNYPAKIGSVLGATVYNEAVGSSGVRAGHYNFVNGSDPMGYSGLYFESLMRSLSLSAAEKQAIFDNWGTWQPLIPTAPTTIPDASTQAFYKSCSWDQKLTKYLTGGSIGKVDLYVFDHGHNDAGFGYNYDTLNTMPSDLKDRKYFIGAMNFLIDKILSDNPLARIVFIGHYENDRKAGISVAQQALADYWDFPLFKTWEKMGWSQKQVTSGGTTKTITQWWMPDDLHPSSDTSGKAIQLYADVLTPFVRDVR